MRKGRVAETISIVPAGFKEPQLPDRPSWLREFWVQGFRKMSFKSKAILTEARHVTHPVR